MKKKKMHLHDMFETVILSISNGRINKTALDETLKDFRYKYMRYPSDGESFNKALFKYYNRIRYVDRHETRVTAQFVNLYCTEDYETIKNEYDAKRYKNKYDYSIMNLQPIRQKDTAFGIVYTVMSDYGVSHSFSYAFDMLQFIHTNNIHVIIDAETTFN